MKKVFFTITVLVITCYLSGCNNIDKTNDILNITEEIFLTQITDIYEKPENYMERTIKIEGLYTSEEYNGKILHYIYRNNSVYDTGHGHAHNQRIGFEFIYDGHMPKNNDWIEIVGILKTYNESDGTFIILDASSVSVLDNRGVEQLGGEMAINHDVSGGL